MMVEMTEFTAFACASSALIGKNQPHSAARAPRRVSILTCQTSSPPRAAIVRKGEDAAAWDRPGPSGPGTSGWLFGVSRWGHRTPGARTGGRGGA